MVMVSIELTPISEGNPPIGEPVIVSGGLAMMNADGKWFSGMEQPAYQRPLQWTPTWWMKIPVGN